MRTRVDNICPKLKEGFCDVAGLESEYVECVDNCCITGKWENCWLYKVLYKAPHYETLDLTC